MWKRERREGERERENKRRERRFVERTIRCFQMFRDEERSLGDESIRCEDRSLLQVHEVLKCGEPWEMTLTSDDASPSA